MFPRLYAELMHATMADEMKYNKCLELKIVYGTVPRFIKSMQEMTYSAQKFLRGYAFPSRPEKPTCVVPTNE